MHVRTHTRHGGNNDLIDYNALFVIATIAAPDNGQLTIVLRPNHNRALL